MEATTQTPTHPAPYLSPAIPPSSSPLSPSHLISSITLYLPFPSPRALSFSFSELPGFWRAKGMLQSYWLHNRLLIPLSMKYKRTCITTGGLRQSKKSCNNETRICGVNMKKDAVWNSCCIDLDSIKMLIVPTVSCWSGGTVSGSSERKLLIRKLFYFFFLSSFGVCFGIKVKRKRWTMLMLNLRDTGSISSIKQNMEDFYVLFLFFFVIESSVLKVESLHWRLIFML